MSRFNNYDENDLNAFRDNESRIKTDDRDEDEFSPESVFGFDNESVHPYFGLDTDCMGNCFTDADPEL